MARKKYKTIPKSAIKEEIRYIEGTADYYVSESGDVYRKYTQDGYYKLKPYLSPKGYVYARVLTKDENRTKNYRVHRLVAQCFIYNDDPINKDIVMHLDNDKLNNHHSNLKWGTITENTQQAFDDGLIVNDKGYEDSQSHPIDVFDMEDNLLYKFGSITQANKELGVSKSTIMRQCKGETKGRPRCGYKFRFQEEYLSE